MVKGELEKAEELQKWIQESKDRIEMQVKIYARARARTHTHTHTHLCSTIENA
jgi:hypothetical protein